jgi:hypothetical protein
MQVNPILIEAFAKHGPTWLVCKLAEAIKDGSFPPPSQPHTVMTEIFPQLFPKYTLFGMDISVEELKEARKYARTLTEDKA